MKIFCLRDQRTKELVALIGPDGKLGYVEASIELSDEDLRSLNALNTEGD
jgi:hypothetical protein